MFYFLETSVESLKTYTKKLKSSVKKLKLSKPVANKLVEIGVELYDIYKEQFEALLAENKRLKQELKKKDVRRK